MSEPFDVLLEKYARLVVRVGVDVQPGQEVVVNALPEQADAARALAEEAYRVGRQQGGRSTTSTPPAAGRRAPRARGAARDRPGARLDQVRSWQDESRPALISLTGNPFPTLMDGLDPERLAKSQPMDLISEIMPLVANDVLAWTVVGAPTQGWADSIGVADVAQLWDAVAIAMRLDQADPQQAWRDHIAKLQRRAAVLNGHAFDRVRYQGPGTDITIGLAPGTRWLGPTTVNADGIEFVPNMPTEEVFMSPDWRRAEGKVRTAAPFFLSSMGTMVEGLELELRDGTITGARA